MGITLIVIIYVSFTSWSQNQQAGRLLQEARSMGLDNAGGNGANNSNQNNDGKPGCANTPYVLIGDIMTTMPPVVPASQRMNPPPHIQLCQEFLRRYSDSKSSGNDQNENGNVNFGSFRVEEDGAVCEDWEAPHYSILSIYASSLIAAVGKPLGLRYKHGCRNHMIKMHQDPTKHYDYTPVQTLLPENLISKTDAAKVEPELIQQLCQGCIQGFEQIHQGDTRSLTHQCLLMPDEDTARTILEGPKPMELPLTSVLPSLIDRLRHMADDWIVMTNVLKNEHESGVIIAVDERSTMMNYDVYDSVIPNGVVSIQIFASASCAVAYVEGRSDCIEHGRRLKRYFIQTRPDTYVRYDVVGSTAASYARMINARILVCPPGTVMCMLPALGKKAGKKAYIAEDSSEKETYKWFENHILEERKRLGFQEEGFDAVSAADFLDIISDVDTSMPLGVIGEEGAKEEPPEQPNNDEGDESNNDGIAVSARVEGQEGNSVNDFIVEKSDEDGNNRESKVKATE